MYFASDFGHVFALGNDFTWSSSIEILKYVNANLGILGKRARKFSVES